MFTKIIPTTDSQLSNEGVANLVVSDALRKISQLTGLSEHQAFALLSSQVNPASNDNKVVKFTPRPTPLLDQNESQFISNLFI
ncbi:hypothetical protein CXF85_01265 [Colwellia sp. 75C3]|uniref:hypothetical protein n=1 Tax=Colwellia sp. 75C3 TaxID=888425 RepID=UPI000C34C68B|nr:hypothetical protein [Colwellia sp. 75C3]PKG86360.1 hypothetical protein CXF85_01265 [Colwellia sp. 75C3]